MKYKVLKDCPADDIIIVASKTKVLGVDSSSLYGLKEDTPLEPKEGDIIYDQDINDIHWQYSKKEWREINKRLEKYWQT